MEGDDIQARIDRLDFARASFKDECAISNSGRFRLAQEDEVLWGSRDTPAGVEISS